MRRLCCPIRIKFRSVAINTWCIRTIDRRRSSGHPFRVRRTRENRRVARWQRRGNAPIRVRAYTGRRHLAISERRFFRSRTSCGPPSGPREGNSLRSGHAECARKARNDREMLLRGRARPREWGASAALRALAASKFRHTDAATRVGVARRSRRWRAVDDRLTRSDHAPGRATRGCVAIAPVSRWARRRASNRRPPPSRGRCSAARARRGREPRGRPSRRSARLRRHASRCSWAPSPPA